MCGLFYVSVIAFCCGESIAGCADLVQQGVQGTIGKGSRQWVKAPANCVVNVTFPLQSGTACSQVDGLVTEGSDNVGVEDKGRNGIGVASSTTTQVEANPLPKCSPNKRVYRCFLKLVKNSASFTLSGRAFRSLGAATSHNLSPDPCGYN